MSDVFAGGAAKIKDCSAASNPNLARRSFELKNPHPASATPSGTSDEEPRVLTSKFKIRGGARVGSSSRNTPSGAAAAGEATSTGAVLQPFSSLFSRASTSSKSHPRGGSPPPTTPTSSAEQMPPPPVAPQRRLPSSHVVSPRRSTSRCSNGPSESSQSGNEGDRMSNGALGLLERREQLGSRARSAEQQRDSPAAAAVEVGETGSEPHGEQPVETKTKSSSEDNHEETLLCITEGHPPPSPRTGGDENYNEGLVMSGGSGKGYQGGNDESSEEESSSEEEDEVLLAGEEASRVGTKRQRHYEDTEDEAEYKRRGYTRLSPTETDERFVEYRSSEAYLQNDAFVPYEQHQPHAHFGFASPDQQQQHEKAYRQLNRTHYEESQRTLTTHQSQVDPLASVAELFPGSHPHLQQAQARLHAQYHLVGSESIWENCSLEEWKEGGDELARQFGALVGKVVTLVVKKSTRTDGFRLQMQEHRNELQQQETKLEGTKEGLFKWAAVVGLDSSA